MPYEDPDWPSQATSEGQSIRLAAGLSNPGNPRRAGRMLLWLAAFIGAIALLVVIAYVL